MEQASDKRKNQRERCLVPVDGKEGSVFDNSQTIDISAGGVGLITEKAIPLDEKIFLEIEISPDEDSLLMMGQVKWIQKIKGSQTYRIGMRFTRDLLNSKEKLKQYLISP
jgi:Tfp pilus assembly protein PilZ